jgi:hypothetical protein
VDGGDLRDNGVIQIAELNKTGAATRLNRKTLMRAGDIMLVRTSPKGKEHQMKVLGFMQGRTCFLETRPGYYIDVDLITCDYDMRPAI